MTDETQNTPVADAQPGSEATTQLAVTEAIPVGSTISADTTALDKLDYHPESVEDELPHVVPPYTMLFGRRIETDIYNVIFGILAGITLAEVAVAMIFDPSFILRTPLLVGLSISKALLVVAFYMHLREDSRIFAAAIIIPALISLVCTLFLLGVPYSTYEVAP